MAAQTWSWLHHACPILTRRRPSLAPTSDMVHAAAGRRHASPALPVDHRDRLSSRWTAPSTPGPSLHRRRRRGDRRHCPASVRGENHIPFVGLDLASSQSGRSLDLFLARHQMWPPHRINTMSCRVPCSVSRPALQCLGRSHLQGHDADRGALAVERQRASPNHSWRCQAHRSVHGAAPSHTWLR